MFKSIRKILIIGRIMSLALSGLLFPAHAINAQVVENQNMVKQPVVAVIDEGINFNHPDLVNSNWVNLNESINGADDDNNSFLDDREGWNFINNSSSILPLGGHGTKVAGVILKVYPNAKLMSLIACAKSYGCNESAVIKAIYYAADNGANVINLSLGTEKYSAAFNQAIAYAYGKNIVIVAASGSTKSGEKAKDLGLTPISPICNDNGQNMVLGAGSVDQTGKFLGYDNFGSCVDVLALGEEVYTSFDPNFENKQMYGYVSGTSFAAAFVSGSAAAVLSAHSNWPISEVYDAIILTAKNKDVYKKYFSAGSLDLNSALAFVQNNFTQNKPAQSLKQGQVKGIKIAINTKPKKVFDIRGPAVESRLK
jgi:subtilisin family serine protease